MSSFATALAELDSSLQTIHAQLAGLGAALDVNDVKLNNSLADARYHAATLRELVRAERPDAEWRDRRSLIQMIGELEAAAELRRLQQRRSKLLELADELDSSGVRHRSATRVATLDAIRTEAIRELRTEAARKDRVKELPGPPAVGWVHWACALHEETDAAVLESLRREFPALERFACDMEEHYWVAGKRTGKVTPISNSPAVHPHARSSDVAPRSPVREPEPPLHHIRTEFDKADETGDYNRALSLCYIPDTHAAPAPSREKHSPVPVVSEEELFEAIASAPHAKCCDTCGGTFPAAFDHCPFDETPLRPRDQTALAPAGKQPHASTFDNDAGQIHEISSGRSQLPPQPAQPPAPELVSSAPVPPVPIVGAQAVDAEVERLKSVLAEYGPKYDEGLQLLDKRISRKKIALAAVAVVIFGAMLGAGYRYGRATAATLRTQLAGARNQVEGVVKDSDIQSEIERKLAALQGSVITARVEHGVVTLVGHTPSKWDSVHAESLALETSGVKLVDNRVEVVEEEVPTSPTASAARRKRQN